VASDGLNSNPERGGGGGIGNEEVRRPAAPASQPSCCGPHVYYQKDRALGSAQEHASQRGRMTKAARVSSGKGPQGPCVQLSGPPASLVPPCSSSTSFPWAQAVALCEKMGAAGSSCDQIAQALAKEAVKAGSTDDVTVVVLKLK
jgi:hypothetical protein